MGTGMGMGTGTGTGTGMGTGMGTGTGYKRYLFSYLACGPITSMVLFRLIQTQYLLLIQIQYLNFCLYKYST